MKILIAVLTCHRLRNRADAIRQTWGKDLQGADLKFFLGQGMPERPDEIVLDVKDDYISLPAKIKATCQWADQQDYDFIFKSDDDSYVVPDRLLASGFENWDYTGRLRGPSGPFPAPYCSGFGYWMSRRAFQIIAAANLNGDTAEDRFVANTLLAAGIRPKHDPRYAVFSSYANAASVNEPPRKGNSLISCCEFSPEHMHSIHQQYLTGKSSSHMPYKQPDGFLSDVSILIKTFLRDEYLYRCLASLQQNFPECELVIVDDGYECGTKITLYSNLRERGHKCSWLPFDSGFGAKANEGIRISTRPFILIGSDDFDFAHHTARPGIEQLAAVLRGDPEMHIASGRVNGRAYESCLQVTGRSVKELAQQFWSVRHVGHIRYRVCDLTANFSLIRRSCFGPLGLHWDEDVKIGGGEHGAFFMDAKKLGLNTCIVDGVQIPEMPFNYALMHPSYPQYRKRASQPGRPCLKRRGIDVWYLQDGTVELT